MNFNSSMIKRSLRIFIATVLVILLFVTGAELYSQKTLLENVGKRALSEVSDEAKHYSGSLEYFLELKFKSLDMLADYISAEESTDLHDFETLIHTGLKVNDISGIAYADIEGDVLSSLSIRADTEEKLSGNIADRAYFRKASSWQQIHALQFLPGTSISEEARMMLAVPVVRNNQIIGVLFASMETSFFDSLIWHSRQMEELDMILTDSDGTVISIRNEIHGLKRGESIFDSLIPASDAEQVHMALKAAEGSALKLKDSGCYLACERIGLEDWSLVCTLDQEEANLVYSANTKAVSKMVSIISGVFIASAALIFLTYLVLENSNRRKFLAIQNYSVKMRSFLEESGRLSFDFDAKKQKLTVSEALESFLQYKVPENWYSILAKRKRLHPEFDYQAVMAAYNDVLINGDYHEVTTPIETDKNGQRWIRISMVGARDNDEDIQDVFGTVTDVTDEYLDTRLAKQERDYLFDAIYSFVPVAVSANLTQNSYTMINYLSVSSALPWEGRFDDLILYTTNRIHKDFQIEFINTFSRRSLLKAYADGKKDVTLEHKVYLSAQNKRYWFATKVYFIRDNKTDGDVCILAVSVDITQQKESTALLQRSYDLTIDNMPGFVCKWLIDEDDILLLGANAHFYNFMRVSEENAVNQSIIFGFSREEDKTLLAGFIEQAREKKDISYEGRGYKYDGEEFWMNISGTYFETQNGKNVYYCIISDVTDNVNLREKARQDAKELDIAADMSNLLVIKFDVVGNKLHMLTTNKKYLNNILLQLEGHAPEYAIESGMISISSETSFYNAFSSIRQGSESGEIRFASGKGRKIRWYAGQYHTVFDADQHPVSAIISLQEEVMEDISTTARMIAEFYDDNTAANRKMLIANLRTDRIEFETESEELSFTDEGIVSFGEAVEKIISYKHIGPGCASKCRGFLNRERLTEQYADGRTDDRMEFFCVDDEGRENDVGIRVILQENQFDKSTMASVIVSDVLPEIPEAEGLVIETDGPEVSDSDEDTVTAAVTERDSSKDIFIRTFGYFDVFINGTPISFAHEKSKEMLAVLVHRRGGYVSTADMIAYLWEDEPSTKTTQSRCRQVASRMKHILEDYGIDDIVETVNGKRRIIPEKVRCDYFDYLKDRTAYDGIYNGEYMMNYSWGEGMLAELNDRDY